jgi:hypothetical protein
MCSTQVERVYLLCRALTCAPGERNNLRSSEVALIEPPEDALRFEGTHPAMGFIPQVASCTHSRQSYILACHAVNRWPA